MSVIVKRDSCVFRLSLLLSRQDLIIEHLLSGVARDSSFRGLHFNVIYHIFSHLPPNTSCSLSVALQYFTEMEPTGRHCASCFSFP